MNFTRALLIDDDYVFQLMAAECLRACGISSIETADNGRDALGSLVAVSEPYDLILCDLNMSEMDGVTFIRQLGDSGYTGAFIIVSGEDATLLETVSRLARLKNISLLGVISKPINVEKLKMLLAENTAHSAMGQSENISLTKAELIEFIATERIVPFYQPKLNLVSGDVSGLEVLSRFIGNDGEYNNPEQIIALAEEYHLITELTLSVVGQVVRDLKSWREVVGNICVSFNVSPSSLMKIDFPEDLIQALRGSVLNNNDITLEVTENKMMQYGADVLDVLSRLKLKGFRLSLDDFGTGAASLEQLRLYPFDELKIDKSFVCGLPEDTFGKVAIESAVKLAREIGLKVVAEGVESREVLHFLRKLGVDEIQGYVLGKPMDAQKYFKWRSDIISRRANTGRV